MAVDPLQLYNSKRDFKKTAEPKGKRANKSGNSFVVQKHDATRLHWDFRLEIDGVLKSWAVTRGPSLNPQDKRLAVRTEDHPLGYGTFEGTIPKGEYGGGTVMLWDRGTWAPMEGKSAKDIEEGHLHFTLDGERMKGEWLLVRIKGKPGEKRENWLLRKIDDEYAGSSDELVERAITSVTTGRSMEEIAANIKPAAKAAKKKSGSPPGFVPLQLATLIDHVPDGSDWLHETKYDGYRALISVGGGKAKLFTRTGLDWSDKFPGLIAAASRLEVDSALIDGEIAVMDADGKPSFAALQEAIKEGNATFVYFAFDLLSLDGKDLKKLSNIERKERLRPVIGSNDAVLQYAEHVLGSGEPLFNAMCAAGIEGIISKRADAAYHGRRTHNWLKVKCTRRQEFIVAGWTDSSASNRGFGALLLAVNDKDGLRYCGKVGTGFNAASMTDLRKKFDLLAVDKAPVDVPKPSRRGAHWVRPELVVEVAYATITNDGILRHASYLGERLDKPANDVVAEVVDSIAADAGKPMVKISNRDRVIFPEAKITKGALADYYEAMSPLILATLSQRPLSLVRCPEGRAKQCFFQRHGAADLGDAIRTIDVLGKDGKPRAYLFVNDATGLLETIQMGTIELHGWGARADNIEYPDRMIFDLDPDVGLDFGDVRKAAVDLKQHLSDLGLVSFPMLSGGKGIHVVVPLTPKAEWPEVTDFAKRFAQALSEAEPQRYVATMSKAKRKGKIFIDWLRNQRGSTAILPYSVRAREGAPVAAPIAWSEISEIEQGGHYSLADRNMLQKRATSRLLQGWGQASQVLPGY